MLVRSSVIDSIDCTSTETDASADAEGAGVGAQVAAGDADVRGAGSPRAKSLAFSPVSAQPPPARNTALVLDGAAAAAEPSKSPAVPQPTKSSMLVTAPHGAHDRTVASRTSATLPPLVARLGVPVASGVGSAAPTEPPDASRTR